LTPGGFIFDTAARALGCAVIPAGPGNAVRVYEVIEVSQATDFKREPYFIQMLIALPSEPKRLPASFDPALGRLAGFAPAVQDEIKSGGSDAYQYYGTADLGLVAYETPAREGMVVNEGIIVEVVRPGTGDPVADGEVGEVVVTTLDPHSPWIRLALGDLTAV